MLKTKFVPATCKKYRITIIFLIQEYLALIAIDKRKKIYLVERKSKLIDLRTIFFNIVVSLNISFPINFIFPFHFHICILANFEYRIDKATLQNIH